MAKSSINLKMAKIFAFFHNLRDAVVTYVIDTADRNCYDRTAEEAYTYYIELLNDALSNYTKRTKQRVQTNEKKFLWEAIINLDEDHTLKDLQVLARVLRMNYGWRSVQIAIHRDEGHICKETEQKVYNYHAHIVFFMLNKDGIYIFKKRDFGIKKMEELQTLTSRVLRMERGVSKKITKRVRLEHPQYRQFMQNQTDMKIKLDFFSVKLDMLSKNKKKTAAVIRTLTKKSNKKNNDLHELNRLCEQSIDWIFNDLSKYPKLYNINKLKNNDLIFEWIKAVKSEIHLLSLQNMILSDLLDDNSKNLYEVESGNTEQYCFEAIDEDEKELEYGEDEESYLKDYDDELDYKLFERLENEEYYDDAKECYEEENEMDDDEDCDLEDENFNCETSRRSGDIKTKQDRKKISIDEKESEVDCEPDSINSEKKDSIKKKKATKKRKIKR